MPHRVPELREIIRGFLRAFDHPCDVVNVGRKAKRGKQRRDCLLFLVVSFALFHSSFHFHGSGARKKLGAPQNAKPLTHKINPAACYSPTQLPTQYHRRWRAYLLCSEWEQVWPLRYNYREKISSEPRLGKTTTYATECKSLLG